jgi:hypothetical protein
MDAVEAVVIKTTLLPDITIHPGGSSSSGFSPGDLVLRLFRPQVVVQTAFGDAEIAPYGEPGPSLWPFAAALLVVAVVAVAVNSQ